MKTEHAADKAQGEWTAEYVRELAFTGNTIGDSWSTIANAHNTALTEEREAYALALQMKNIETTRANEAGQQLAAEREDHQRAGKAANEYYSEICKLRDQLVHANDMWDRASRQADTLAEYLVDAKAELSVTQTQLAAAQAAIKKCGSQLDMEPQRLPLVERLQRYIQVALAKVKEGK